MVGAIRSRVRKHRVEERCGRKNGCVCELRREAQHRLVVCVAPVLSTTLDVSVLGVETSRKCGAVQQRVVMEGGTGREEADPPKPQNLKER